LPPGDHLASPLVAAYAGIRRGQGLATGVAIKQVRPRAIEVLTRVMQIAKKLVAAFDRFVFTW
jgi:hypothetical protein|tara:strand:+ start:587 stop:775 length:189 start_codon:yes stop_codon:yes gene_type:complete